METFILSDQFLLSGNSFSEIVDEALTQACEFLENTFPSAPQEYMEVGYSYFYTQQKSNGKKYDVVYQRLPTDFIKKTQIQAWKRNAGEEIHLHHPTTDTFIEPLGFVIIVIPPTTHTRL